MTALRSGRDLHGALQSKADVVLVRGEITEPEIKSAVVTREPVGVALRPDHPLAAHPAISAAQLDSVPLISFSRASDPAEYDRLFGALAIAGLTKPHLVHESHPGAVEGSLRLVASDAGLSLKLESEVDAFGSPDVVWRPLAEVGLEVVISAAWRADHGTPALQRVLPLLPTGALPPTAGRRSQP